MKEKIKELQEWFISQIFAKNFKITSGHQYWIQINIDGMPFTFWMSVHGAKYFDQYMETASSTNFMHLNVKSNEELYNLLLPFHQNWVDTKIMEEKIAQIERLTKEVESFRR